MNSDPKPNAENKSPHLTLLDISHNLGYINRAIKNIDLRITQIENDLSHTVPTRTITTFLVILTTGIFLWLSALTTIVIQRR